MYDFYTALWDKEVHHFFIAFIQKQGMYPKAAKDDHVALSMQELREHRKAAGMTDGIEKGNYVSTRKQIGDG